MTIEELEKKMEEMRTEHVAVINALMAALGIKIVRQGNTWSYCLNDQVPDDMQGILVIIMKVLDRLEGNRKIEIIQPGGL